MLTDASKANLEALYLADALSEPGAWLFVTDNGEIQTMEPGTWQPGETRLLCGEAAGDFLDADWGIEENEAGGYTVDRIPGRSWETRGLALAAAVAKFGLRDEDRDELLGALETRIATEQDAAEQRADAHELETSLTR
jgi:hypothetical protein